MLNLRLKGGTGKALFEARPQFAYVVVLCGPEVETVEVHRLHGVRTADVRVGPGWLTTIYEHGDPATLRAFDTRGGLNEWIFAVKHGE